MISYVVMTNLFYTSGMVTASCAEGGGVMRWVLFVNSTPISLFGKASLLGKSNRILTS